MSDLLDQLRDAVIASESSGPAEHTILLSKVHDRLQHLELMLDWGRDQEKVKALEDKHRIRDTREGEWPEAGTRNLWWDEGRWQASKPKVLHGDVHLWLPAPPPPNE